MRSASGAGVAMMGVLIIWISAPSMPAPGGSEIVADHQLAGQKFSDLYAALNAGEYDAFSKEVLLRALYENEIRLSNFQRDVLIQQVLFRPQAPDTTEEAERSATAVVLSWFEELSEPSLRARILARAAELKLAGIQAAVLHSARRLSDLMRADGLSAISRAHEVEALTLAEVAPLHPSIVLAELLRTIAVYSSNTRVVAASREAARLIILSLRD